MPREKPDNKTAEGFEPPYSGTRPVRILVACDSFKGSLTALEACEAVARAIHASDPSVHVEMLPLADGGEGTVSVLQSALGGSLRSGSVHAADGNSIVADILRIEDGETVVVESASCLGLTQIPATRRSVQRATSFGLGELMRLAVKSTTKSLLVGLGGTATNDAGFGLATALGFRWFGRSGEEIIPEFPLLSSLSSMLLDIRSIARPDVLPGDEIPVTCLCDVDNPLLGKNGATRIYGSQKGASNEDLIRLEEAIEHFSVVVQRDVRQIDVASPGSGAAGGIGFGLAAFCGAELKSGVDEILSLVEFRSRCSCVDLIISGEGKLDEQTLRGKVVSGVGRIAADMSIPYVVVTGAVDGDRSLLCERLEIKHLIALTDGSVLSVPDRVTARETLFRSVASEYSLIRSLISAK